MNLGRIEKMEIVTIANQKGGVGKSTTAHALGAGLSMLGFKVLLIDLDPQSNLTYSLNPDSNAKTAYDLLKNPYAKTDLRIKDVIQSGGSFDIIPSSNFLSRADKEIDDMGKEYRLKEHIDTIKNGYDFIVIDTPPSLGIITINALTASTRFVVPAQADIYSIQGIRQLYDDTVHAVWKYSNSQLKFHGILLTRHNSHPILSRALGKNIQHLAEELETFTYQNVIRECISLKEAQAKRVDIYTHAPQSNAASDYDAFIKEFLERI